MKRERILSRWALLMAGDTGPILAGCEGLSAQRTSTPLVEFDLDTMTVVTASGRPYRLVGPSEPGYALSAFHSLWDAGDTPVRVVSPEDAVRLITEKGNKPFEFTPEEQARLDLARLRHTAAQIVRQMRVLDLDEHQAAQRSGLTLDQMHGLLEHDLSRIAALEADQAFVRLVGTAYGWVRTADNDDAEIIPWGSGNVWEDLGLPDPEDDDDREPKP